MKIDLKGYQAVVGGATSGLGLAIAQQLAACGASVTLLARNKEKLEVAKKSLDVSGGQHHQYLEVDFANFESFRAATDFFLKVKEWIYWLTIQMDHQQVLSFKKKLRITNKLLTCFLKPTTT
ncbi:SDR family NAD(P)-dependent oxidoreductase [uncultured Cyclobacterium sp.]|uniref:SDR family NAD(P)-dependent oxidoreductase n=1 Tax=uncultured Cyclobacterium sp. TaxID=453820 RepID=UPI0030EB4E43|tara:strand:+ start:48935 stop:49300 length:366 start_codon:yes stop_codon:yes gene_type:complete